MVRIVAAFFLCNKCLASSKWRCPKRGMVNREKELLRIERSVDIIVERLVRHVRFFMKGD